MREPVISQLIAAQTVNAATNGAMTIVTSTAALRSRSPQPTLGRRSVAKPTTTSTATAAAAAS